MKRILRVSFDILITSVIPIAQYFFIGILLDSNLVNIFVLTYPLQFVMNLFKSLFATGANILACKENNKNVVDCGIFLGTIVGAIFFGILVYHIDHYIQFMNMDVKTYRVFGIYSVIQIYLQLILQLILTKLYYEEKNKKANRIAIQFNVFYFICIIGFAFLTRNQVISVSVSLIIMFIYIALLLIVSIDKFEFHFDFMKCIQYDSVDFFSGIVFIFIYLLGFKNAFSFGENYVLAISFATLVTDTQWDVIHSIVIVEKVDIAKKSFVFKKHMKNAYQLDAILIALIGIMIPFCYAKYQPDLKIALLFISGEILMLVMYPIYMTRTCYLQLEYSATKTTIHKQVANILRLVLSVTLVTPYCTIIAQLASMLYQLIYTKMMWLHKESKLGKIPKRKLEYNLNK